MPNFLFLDHEERLDSVETTVLNQGDQILNLSDRVDVLEQTDTTIQSDINDLENIDGG